MTKDVDRPSRDEDEDDAPQDRRWDTGSFVTGLLIGAALGAGVALLLAPASGEETRRVIRRKARSVGDEVGDGWISARDEARRVLQEKKEALRRRVERELPDREDATVD
jgi:gas vesicle protein